MKYTQLKKLNEEKYSEVLKNNKSFFAFSDRQLDEGLKENGLTLEEVTGLSMGQVIPRANIEKYKQDVKDIDLWYNEELKKINPDEVIEYELCNYESYYTGSLIDAMKVLEAHGYTRDQVLKVYNKNQSKHYED